MQKQPKKPVVVKKKPSKFVRFGRRVFPTTSRKIYAGKLVKNVFKAEFGKNLGTVTLYGSVARGEAKVKSDIDLNVFVKEWADLPDKRKHDAFWNLRNKVDKMAKEGGFRVDFHIHDAAGTLLAKGDKKIFG